MTEITAGMVKELREKTGAGMKSCKDALVENKGNFDEAVDWLRKKGLAAATKKSSRVAAEGLVGVSVGDKLGAVIEVNSETDFVARNEQFQGFVRDLAGLSVKVGIKLEDLVDQTYPGKSIKISEQLTNLISSIGENMNIRRVTCLSVQTGVVVPYMHNAIAPNVGKIGVLVALESTGDKDRLNALGRQIAMHVAAARPDALDIASVSAEQLEREKNILADQARASGKPEEIVQKMLEGRVKKYYEDVVLLEQNFVMNPDLKVKAVVENLAKELGTAVTLKAFARFELGEGIEREVKDFAAEVAAQLAS